MTAGSFSFCCLFREKLFSSPTTVKENKKLRTSNRVCPESRIYRVSGLCVCGLISAENAFLCRLNWSGSPTVTSDLWARSVKAAGGLERLFISSREAHNTLFTFSFSRRIIEKQNNRIKQTVQSDVRRFMKLQQDVYHFDQRVHIKDELQCWSEDSWLQSVSSSSFIEVWNIVVLFVLVSCETDVDPQTSRTISQTTQLHSDGWGESDVLTDVWEEFRLKDTSRNRCIIILR